MRTPYHISYNMAMEVIYCYLERIYQLNKHKGTSIAKVEELFHLDIELKGLVDQLRADRYDIDSLIQQKKESLNIKYLYDKIDVYIDGSTRGVESPEKEKVSGAAFSILADGKIVHEECKRVPTPVRLPKLRNEKFSAATDLVVPTTNIAEYFALIQALEYLLDKQVTAAHIEIFSDSGSVVHQVNKVNTTRATNIIRLRDCAWELMANFDNLTITHIPREDNDHVDWMLCKFLDNIQGIRRDRETRRIIKAVPAWRQQSMMVPF